MRRLEDIINCAEAPFFQWEPVIGKKLSEGKKHEDMLTHFSIAVAIALKQAVARKVTGIIADEARMEIHSAWLLPSVKQFTHLTVRGKFEMAAHDSLRVARIEGSPRVDRVRVTTDADSIKPKSQDAVVANMILGCLATAEDHSNLHKMLTFVATLLKPDGQLIVVRPNPEGGAFSTYKCTTPACDLKGGDNYDFIVNGQEDHGEMKNLYTPDDFIRKEMDAAGFDMGETKGIHDTKNMAGKPPFLMNICSLKR